MTPEKRQAYIDKMSAQLDEWEGMLDVGKARIAKKVAGAKIAAHDGLEDLDDVRESMRRKLAELKTAKDEKWDALKREVDRSWESLKDRIGGKDEKRTS